MTGQLLLALAEVGTHATTFGKTHLSTMKRMQSAYHQAPNMHPGTSNQHHFPTIPHPSPSTVLHIATETPHHATEGLETPCCRTNMEWKLCHHLLTHHMHHFHQLN